MPSATTPTRRPQPPCKRAIKKKTTQSSSNTVVHRLLLVLSKRPKMPRLHAPRVPCTDKDLEAGTLLLSQFLERPEPVLRLVGRTIRALPKAEAVDVLAFLAGKVTFYDVELLITDPLRFKCRLAMWKKKARTKMMDKTPVNISDTLELLNLYTRCVTNESNMYKGRNTLNEDKEDV